MPVKLGYAGVGTHAVENVGHAAGGHRSLLAYPKASIGVVGSRAVWPSPVLTDIHDRAAKSRKAVQNGDHGREEKAATAVVFR